MGKIGIFIGVLLYASISTIRSNRKRRLEKEQKISKKIKEELKKIGDTNEH